MATCKNCGNPLILSGGMCTYCGAIPNQASQYNAGKQVGGKSKQIVQRRSFANHPKSIEELKIKVTSPCYDDIGQVLNQLGVSYLSFDGDYNCDILFLNCGTSDRINPQQLNAFVQKGGILYASDLTSDIVIGTWPDIMRVDNDTSSCTIRAKVVDPDLQQYIGDIIDVEFDLGVWSKIIEAPQGKVLMQSKSKGFPIMVEFSIGQGKVFYTSFHNHAQTAEAEKKLLQLLVIKQVASATKQDFRKTVSSMSVKF